MDKRWRSCGANETIHISGCANRCAHQGAATLTAIGRDGACDLFVEGAPAGSCEIVATVPAIIANRLRSPAETQAMSGPHTYLRDGAAIYERSFATIRAEADLARFTSDEESVVVRMIHACGQVEAAQHIAFGAGFVAAARAALAGGAPVLCDAEMVAHGITRARLPAKNEVICTLRDPRVPEVAEMLRTTRSAAALDLWRDKLAGSVVAIGNAPTALFRLLELIGAGAAKPAAIIGCPVGFVGAAESKAPLAADPHGVPWLIVRGRMGGSAIAAAAVNALARSGLQNPGPMGPSVAWMGPGSALHQRARARRCSASGARGL